MREPERHIWISTPWETVNCCLQTFITGCSGACSPTVSDTDTPQERMTRQVETKRVWCKRQKPALFQPVGFNELAWSKTCTSHCTASSGPNLGSPNNTFSHCIDLNGLLRQSRLTLCACDSQEAAHSREVQQWNWLENDQADSKSHIQWQSEVGC